MEMQAKLRVNKDLAKSASAENVNTSYIGYNSNEGDNIKVYVRIRPPHKQIIEGSTDQSICLEVTSPQSLTIATKPEPKQFSYDYVAHMETTQEEVFATVGKGIIEAFVNGFNGTIFAYGQTGSGKTFTMLGPADDTDNFSHELRGVIPRGFEYLFSLINREQEKAGDRVEFLARCSFLEIYNEQVFDLLEPSTASLHLRENMKKGVFVEGLAERDVTSAKDAYDVLQSGWSNRRVASTSMNRESSRSHAVFTVTLESKKRSGGMNNIKISKLHLVDLAGSERQKDTQTADLRLKEAGSINKSLSALGNVIMSLVDIAHGKNRHIHYRDSKLTFILRDSLGGNAKTYIIANVHPSSRCFGETLSTLNFARRAKMIKNKAFINEDVSGNVSELQAEIRKLKELLAQAKAGIAPEASSSSSTETSNSGSKGTLSEDGLQWKDMMLNAISERDQSEIEKNSLQEKVLKLEELCSKKDKFYHSTKMILKFRNDAIAKLQRQLKKELGPQEEDGKDKEIKLLKEEIKLLAANIENHPDVKKFAFENLELRKEIKRLKQHDHAELSKQLAEKSRYTLQLERKLRESFTFKSNDLEKSLSSSQQSLDASNAEIEKLKMELVQIQAKLDTSQNDLLQSRHAFQEQSEQLVSLKESGRKKELELQSDLAAFRKSNNELERTLEAFQLRTAVERTAMNSLHIQTIKTLSSPRKFGTPQKNRLINTSKQSTPIKTVNGSDEKQTVNGVKTGACARSDSSKDRNRSLQTTSDYGEYVNDLNRLLEDEPPPKSLQRKDSLNDITDDEDDTSPFWKSVNETRDDEIVYLEALQDEIKHLQNLHSEAIANLYKEQKSKIPMVESVAKLEHKVQDLDKLLCNERSSWSAKEADLTSQLTVLRDNYKEAQGSATILKSEVDDLRIHLQVTEKQFASLKKDKTEEILEIEGRITVLESKNVKLEIDNMNLRNEVDATAETNNNLQANYEESQEELEFTRHKSNELEKILLLERKKIKELEEELQAVAEKLNNEIEARMKLTQEDTEQELVKSFETINVLREELNAIAKKSAEQAQEIAKLSSDLERARSDAATQKWMNLKDKDAINKFMARVDEYTKTIAEKDFAISSMTSELDDVKEQYERSVQSCEEKKKKIQKLTEALQAESEKLLKEKLDREKEVTGLAEEIQTAQDQCKELQENLYEQRAQLEFLREDHLNAKKTIAEQKNIVLLLEEEKQNLQKTESSELFDDSIVYVENHEIDEAKKQLLDVTRLTDTYKANEVEFKKEIADLQRRFSEYEIIETKKDELEERGRILEEEIEHLEQENTQLKERLLNMDKEISVERVEIEGIKNSLQQARNSQKQAEIEKLEAEQKLSALEMNMFNVQDDLEATQEELEKTKALEEKYFEESNRLRSKLESADEEKTRFEQQIEQLIKAKEALELEKSRLYGHRNHNQKIEYVTNLKKENNSLKEQIQKVLMSVNKMESCDRCRQRNENIIESAPIKC